MRTYYCVARTLDLGLAPPPQDFHETHSSKFTVIELQLTSKPQKRVWLYEMVIDMWLYVKKIFNNSGLWSWSWWSSRDVMRYSSKVLYLQVGPLCRMPLVPCVPCATQTMKPLFCNSGYNIWIRPLSKTKLHCMCGASQVNKGIHHKGTAYGYRALWCTQVRSGSGISSYPFYSQTLRSWELMTSRVVLSNVKYKFRGGSAISYPFYSQTLHEGCYVHC